MAYSSEIEWTQTTWNPVTGCTKVNSGCKFCYAERFSERFCGVPGHPFEQGFDLKLHPERLELPFSWKKPRLVFVNSMSDLFHEDIPDDFKRQVFETMAAGRRRTFQVLTKRIERVQEFFQEYSIDAPRNVWIGTSIEAQELSWRVDELRGVQAVTRFLSCEPLLGPLEIDLTGIHWVIVGGESGPGCRPIDPDWVRSLQQQCQKARVPFFFKQWGGVQKIRNGRELDGRTWDEMPSGWRLGAGDW